MYYFPGLVNTLIASTTKEVIYSNCDCQGTIYSVLKNCSTDARSIGGFKQLCIIVFKVAEVSWEAVCWTQSWLEEGRSIAVETSELLFAVSFLWRIRSPFCNFVVLAFSSCLPQILSFPGWFRPNFDRDPFCPRSMTRWGRVVSEVWAKSTVSLSCQPATSPPGSSLILRSPTHGHRIWSLRIPASTVIWLSNLCCARVRHTEFAEPPEERAALETPFAQLFILHWVWITSIPLKKAIFVELRLFTISI